MKQYWPMAVVLDKGEPLQLFTYDSCLSIKDCKKVFLVWQDSYGYTLLSTWIEVSEDGEKDIINLECHINSIGKVTKIC